MYFICPCIKFIHSMHLVIQSIYLFNSHHQSIYYPSDPRVPVQATNRLWQRVDYGMLSVDIYRSLLHFNRSYLDTPIILSCYEICWTYKKTFSSFSYQCWKVWTYEHMYIHTYTHAYIQVVQCLVVLVITWSTCYLNVRITWKLLWHSIPSSSN